MKLYKNTAPERGAANVLPLETDGFVPVYLVLITALQKMPAPSSLLIVTGCFLPVCINSSALFY